MMEQRKVLARFLKELGFIKDEFTGKITLNFNQGGLVDGHRTVTSHEGECKVERTERIK